jgi:hypothetical protein
MNFSRRESIRWDRFAGSEKLRPEELVRVTPLPASG